MDVITTVQHAQPGDVVLVTERSRPGGNYGADTVEYRTFAAEALRPGPGVQSERALAAAGVYVAGTEGWAPGSCGLPAEGGEWGVIGVEVIGKARPYGKVQSTAPFVARRHAPRLGRELRQEPQPGACDVACPTERESAFQAGHDPHCVHGRRP